MSWKFSTYKHKGFCQYLYLHAEHDGTQTKTIDAQWIERELCYKSGELKAIAEQWGFKAEITSGHIDPVFFIIFGLDNDEVRAQADIFIDQVLMPMATMSTMIKGG